MTTKSDDGSYATDIAEITEEFNVPTTVPPTTPSSTPALPVIIKPRMGGVDFAGTKDAVAWTGGQPRLDWKRLQDPHAEMYSPNCVRSTQNSERAKSFNRRVAAPDTLFKKESSSTELTRYAEKVLAHAQDTGMDTIFYVSSLSKPGEMVCVLKDFDQVTLNHVIDEARDNEVHYDSYDKLNDRAARQYLENSLDPEMKEELSLRQTPEDGAAVTWMRILRSVSDSSVERFTRKKEELKALSPAKEPGENVVSYANKVRRICKDLEQAHQFDWILVLAIIKALLQVSVESFRALFHPIRVAVDAVLSECAFLTREAARNYMVREGYHYTQVLTMAEETYRSLLDNGDWLPALAVKDPQQAPTAFFAGMDEVQFNALVQSSVDKRFNAAVKGTSGSTPKASGTKETVTANRNAGPDGNWRAVAPKPGEPTTKTNKSGRVFNYCTKCNRGKGFWTATHTDEQHGVPGSTTTPQANIAAENDDAGLGIYQF